MEIKFNPRAQFPGRGPCIEMMGEWVTPAVHEVVAGLLGNNWMDSPIYQARTKAHAFFQGGYDKPDGEWILLEFWADEDSCVDFVKLLNEEINKVIDEDRVRIKVIAKSQNDKDQKELKDIVALIADETKCAVGTVNQAAIDRCTAVFLPANNVEYRAVQLLVNYTFNLKQVKYFKNK